MPQANASALSLADGDFPFYNDEPIALSTWQWVPILLGVAAGFGALVAPVPIVTNAFAASAVQFVQALLFPALPLLALAVVAKNHWTTLFAKVGWREVKWMIGIGLLNIVVSACVAVLVQKWFATDANPTVAAIKELPPAQLILFLLKTIPQLLGEELLTMLPFLAILFVLVKHAGLSRRASILVAWFVSAAIFGAAHLSTYDWNWIQCFVIIGSARLVLTLAYLQSKNILVSAGAHIFCDWTYFAGVLFIPKIA